MNWENRIGNFSRAGIGLLTFAISLAFCFLVGFSIVNLNTEISVQFVVFVLVFALLAIWFGKLGYQTIFQTSEKHTRLFSPLSIIVIFSILGVGAITGAIFRFTTGDYKNGFLSLFVLLMLFPLGLYCWKHAKNQ